MEQMVPKEDDRGSDFAMEGTMAHELGEIIGQFTFGYIDAKELLRKERAWKKAAASMPFVDIDETYGHVTNYIAFLKEKAAEIEDSTVLLEQRMNTGVPECWGTSDAVIVSPEKLHIVDLKYGRGVVVDVEDNSQLLLYACGALDTFGDVLGETEEILMSIYQPRVGNIVTHSISADDLRAWREKIIPIAEEALAGSDRFGPSPDACRWCPAQAICRPRVEMMTEVDFAQPLDTISLEELSELLTHLPDIEQWCSAVADYALKTVYSDGAEIPGWKVVKSGGRRSIKDQTAAIQAFIDHGYDAEKVADFKTKGLGELEKVAGSRQQLEKILGNLIVKSEGSPSLVPESDKRESINPHQQASKDFGDL